MSAIISLANVTKDYGNNKGIFDVSFEVKSGETFGFLGPNGAGKTTTIRNLLGFIRPDSGILSILGRDCFSQADEISRKLGYLPGEIAFIDGMNGMDFIRFAAGMKELRSLRKAKNLISRFELDPAGKIKKMSKGMKQKLGIVCALMGDPEILILDEPTSGLDPLMQNEFVDVILEEKEKGTTILMSSHIFEEVERTCDRIAIIRQGRIVDITDMAQLQKNRGKLFEIDFADTAAARLFAAGYPGCSRRENRVALTLAAEVDPLIKQLAAFTIADIRVRTQTLEELFMHFYGGEHDD